MSKKTFHQPHDKLLLHALKNHDVARDAMRAYLPQEILHITNLNNIKLYQSKLVSPQFKEFEADIIYEVALEDSTGLILFHCEQQSTVEKGMPLRIWQYLLLILMEYYDNHKTESLPVIYPIIIYTGNSPYHESTNFFDLFGKNKALAEKFLLQDIMLVDVCRMSDEDIQKHQLFGLIEYAFKHKKTKQFEAFLQVLMPWLHEVELQIGGQYAKMVLKYVVDIFPEENYDLLNKATNSYLFKELGEEAMTIAEMLEQRGMQRGLQQGEYLVLSRQLERKFSIIPKEYQERLQAADAETLLNWAERLMEVESLEELFKDD